MDRADRPPGRDTTPAYTKQRRIWYGYGEQADVEKGPLGRFLHDVPQAFMDVFFPSIPVLLFVALAVEDGGYGVSGAVLVTWTTMTLVAALVRGGWIPPVATDTLGWVTFHPVLLGLRIIYYNLLLLVAGYGGVWVASVSGYPPASLLFAMIVSTLAMLAFPRIAESVARRTF